jgi:hypothetical protein
VHNTVEREIKLCSAVVFKSSVEDPVVTPDKLKLALKVRLGSKTEAGTSLFSDLVRRRVSKWRKKLKNFSRIWKRNQGFKPVGLDEGLLTVPQLDWSK